MDQATMTHIHVALIPQVRPRNCSSAGDQRRGYWLLTISEELLLLDTTAALYQKALRNRYQGC